MSMLMHYKIKGIDKIHTTSSACSTVVWSDDHLGCYKLLPQGFKHGYTSYRRPEVQERILKLDTRNKVEYFEFRMVKFKAEWYDWFESVILRSSIAPYLHLSRHKQVRYRFTLDEDYTRMLFIISLLRYTTEYTGKISKFYQDLQLYPDLNPTPDETLAMLSGYIGLSAHSVFKPFSSLKGLFGWMDKYMDMMLNHGAVKLRDDIQKLRKYKPRNIIERKYGSGYEYFGEPSIKFWYKHFSEVKKDHGDKSESPRRRGLSSDVRGGTWVSPDPWQ